MNPKKRGTKKSTTNLTRGKKAGKGELETIENLTSENIDQVKNIVNILEENAESDLEVKQLDPLKTSLDNEESLSSGKRKHEEIDFNFDNKKIREELNEDIKKYQDMEINSDDEI
ncbi:hypothetical protein HK096_001250, partial [Nowakowskiella sp. JEL0078]